MKDNCFTVLFWFLQLIHADVYQKPKQYCKAIILHLKINKFKKSWLKKKIMAEKKGKNAKQIYHGYNKKKKDTLFQKFKFTKYFI